MKRIILVSMVFVVLTGCGGKPNPNGSVTGAITYNGKPVNGALLQFYPVSDKGNVVRIGVGQDGTFTASDIPPGEYKVVVKGSKPPPELMNMPEPPKGADPAKAAEFKQKFQETSGEMTPTIAFPKKYEDAESTDLKCTITQGKQKLTLELKD